MLRFGLVWFGW